MNKVDAHDEAGAWPEGVLSVRLGPGANCSSIGSAVELLFLSATVGAALLTALSASLEPAGSDDEPPAPEPEPEAKPSPEGGA